MTFAQNDAASFRLLASRSMPRVWLRVVWQIDQMVVGMGYWPIYRGGWGELSLYFAVSKFHRLSSLFVS